MGWWLVDLPTLCSLSLKMIGKLQEKFRKVSDIMFFFSEMFQLVVFLSSAGKLSGQGQTYPHLQHWSIGRFDLGSGEVHHAGEDPAESQSMLSFNLIRT